MNAWADGQLHTWATFKNDHEMGYFTRGEALQSWSLAKSAHWYDFIAT